MATQELPNILVKRYRRDRDFQADAHAMAQQGYRVQSTTSERPNPGCMRIILTGGLGLLFFRPKPQLVVTYARQ